MSAEVVLLLLAFSIQCLQSYSLRSFTLQSPLMPYNGDGWAVHYDSTYHKIWLLNPRICDNSSICSDTTHVVSYDIYNNSFTIEASTAEPMALHYSSNCATSINDTIYFNDATNVVIGSYNIRTSEWKRPFQTMPHSVLGACLVSDDRYIYAIGGHTITIQFVTHLQIYDLNNNVWLSSVNSLNHDRVWSTCQLHNGTIYVFGGVHSTDTRQSIEMIFVGSGDDVITNAATQSWILLPEMLHSQSMGLSSVICANIDTQILYLLGGRRSYPYDVVEIFNLNTHSLTTLSITLNQARTGHASICINNYIYAFGGAIGTTDAGQTTYTWGKSNMLYYIAPTTSVPSLSPTETYTTSDAPSLITQNYSVSTVYCPDSNDSIVHVTDTSLVYIIVGCVVILVLCFIVIIVLFLKLKAMQANIARDDERGVDNEGAQVECEEQKDDPIVGNVAIVATYD